MINKITEDFSLSLKDDLSDLFLLLAEEIKKIPTASPIKEEIKEEYIAPIEKVDLSIKSDDLSEFFDLFGKNKSAKIIPEQVIKPEEKIISETVKPILPKIEKNIDSTINLSDINKRINNLINDTNRKLQKLIEHSTLAYGGGSGSYWLNDLGDTDHNSIITAEQGDVLLFDSIKNKWVASKGTSGVIIDDTEIVFGTGIGIASSNNLTWNGSSNTLNVININTSNTISIEENLFLKTQKQILSNLTGNTVITSGTMIPDGAFVMGVTTKIIEQLSANGYSVGNETLPTLWGTKNSNTVGTITKSSDYIGYDAVGLFTESSNVAITTTGEPFTGGSIEISTFYFITDPT